MSTRINQSQLESYLWDAAVLLRGYIDAGDYKQFIFPLLFYKRLCDVFDEEVAAALAESGGDQAYAHFAENHRFQIPEDAHWKTVREASKNVGTKLQSALRAIETANPDKLFGIFGDAQWTNKDRLSPDVYLSQYESEYRWLTQVYESVKPPSGNGKLLWHVLGAKTIELIHQNTHLESIRDDLESLVMDAEAIQGLLSKPSSNKESKTLEIKLIARLRKHAKDPKFIALGERLEKIREKHEKGLVDSKEFLKLLLDVARDVLEAEKRVDPVEEQSKAKSLLTELFQQVKNEQTPVIVERIVAEIDEIVRMVRFPGWQHTSAGEREVQKALRRTLLKYQLHKDQDLFDRAYGYILQYY